MDPERVLPSAPSPLRRHETRNKCASKPTSKPKWGIWVLVVIYSLIILGVGMILGSLIKPTTGHKPRTLRRIPFYSPIEQISDNHRIPATPNPVFFGEPTDENNAAWANICGVDGGRVGISDRRALRNLPTSVAGGTKAGEFVYGLGVCHQLHCLDHIRLALHQDPEKSANGEHLDHCVEYLRQVLICKADVSMHYWKSENETAWDVVHQCWNFDKVVEWAQEHRVTRKSKAVR